ncbi:MAG: branched-chain amino acid ABC transporter ATP-binding protein/permease [Castellaniella sp.]|uniref:branched-chain amino acid ABC transporter ATP-binding protein/permease n=1 Tax=Castellaniella sp. TaxID=1955812 RepID=UPI00121F367B|nr:branched-chain amino acid ABC transporter ATP-binding protein/permease [Castellaniella sp.]TAN29708.1 MAG: branched-chain amino acid ABC transporter ATP-binding protein/permease [Castellaniella sp.]
MKIIHGNQLLIAVPVILILAAVPIFGSVYAVSFLFSVLIFYILAASWDWVAGEMGYINLGHYVFYGVGAYLFSLSLVSGIPIWLSILIALVVTGVVGLLIAFPLFRLRGDYFAFATLALLPLFELIASNLTSITNGVDGIILPAANILTRAYYLAVVLCAVTFLTTLWLTKRRFGYELRSIRNDESMAEMVGVRITPVKVLVLGLSASFAALAGAIQAWQLNYIDPRTVFGLDIALVPIAMALFGGSGLRWGPVVGVVILAFIQQWLLINLQFLHVAVFGLIILLIGRFMPGGLLRATWLKRIPALNPLTREHHEFVVQDALIAAPAGAKLPLVRAAASDKAGPVLECRNVRMEFGGNIAVNDVSLVVQPGEIVGLIGPNGSGKTTLFNCISRVLTPTAGTIRLDGRGLAALRRDEIAQLGVGRTNQIPRPFGDLTVRENVAVPLMHGKGCLEPREALSRAASFISYVGLANRIDDRADALSLQEKKALEFARAIATRPRLLLVDEVASGLTPVEIDRFVEHIRGIRDDFGITVIWVEHIFSALAKVVDRVVVLEQGTLIADGPLESVIQDQRVLDTYLGSALREVA